MTEDEYKQQYQDSTTNVYVSVNAMLAQGFCFMVQGNQDRAVVCAMLALGRAVVDLGNAIIGAAIALGGFIMVAAIIGLMR